MLGNSNVPLYKNKDFGDIQSFHLLFGPACNMHCRHCVQHHGKKIYDKFSSKLNPKVWELIKNYIIFCLEHALQFKEFIFWGGEPLLHLKIIKDIVNRTKNEFGITESKNFNFLIVSNGLLLNDEIINFINETGVKFLLSYDAPYPFAVRDYVSDEICNKVRKIKRYSILASCNAINHDPLLAYYCLSKKFPNATEIDVNPNLTQAPDISRDIYNWDWNIIRNNLKKLRIAAQMDNKFVLNLIYRYYLSNGHTDSQGVNISKSIGIVFLNCTLDGNVLSNHNSFDQVGTVDDSLQKLHENSYERLRLLKSPECKTCRHIDICGANKYQNAKNENNRYYACSNYWFKFYDILKMELVNLRKPLSEEDRIWYQEQEEIMKYQIKDFLNEGLRYARENTRLPKEIM